MSHQNRLTAELSSLEKEYKRLAKKNPISANETRENFAQLELVVARMKAIRNSKTINRPVIGNSFLSEILRESA